MKNFFIIALFQLLCYGAKCQTRWNATIKKTDSNHYLLIVSAALQDNWYIYAKSTDSDGPEGIDLKWENAGVEKKERIKADILPVIIKDPLFEKKSATIYNRPFKLSQTLIINGAHPQVLIVSVNGFASNGHEFLPLNERLSVPFQAGSENFLKLRIRRPGVDIEKPLAECGDESNSGKGLALIFFMGFAGGFIALLTPCVFPMIPITVSFFTTRALSKNQGIGQGLLYGLFIFLIYASASIPFHLISDINPPIFNIISTNAWVNLFFFLIFVIFALSLLGVFEITLPSRIATKADSKSSTANMAGIFFLALTLAIVSFSCTGPILGSLLAGAFSTGANAWKLTAGICGFGCALALPFSFFALFPQWMKKLPSNGPWLVLMKKVLAMIEFALALKFLSNADLVMHWGILKREIFIGLWLIIAIVIAIFLLVPGERSWIARSFGMISLFFICYLASGLISPSDCGLKLLSGFAPPIQYSIHGNLKTNYKGLEPDVVNDYDSALALAKNSGKPLLIDFTGWACVNCRKMEEQVWTDQAVKSMIKEKFILVSLYVDDRKKLDEPFTYSGREFNTVGDQWAGFEAANFSQVTQPLYVLLDPEEKLLNRPSGYQPDAGKYSSWLACGLSAMKNK